MSSSTTENEDGNNVEVYTCIVCFEKYNNSGRSVAVKTPGCDHTVCHTCSRYYLNETLQKPGYRTSELIQCPSTDCQSTYLSTDDLLKIVFSKDEMDIWWSQAIMKTFIDNKVCIYHTIFFFFYRYICHVSSYCLHLDLLSS